MKKIVYFVHCIDTEGPLYESLEATFERIEETFGIKLEPSYKTLKDIQNKKIDLGCDEEAVANLVCKKRLNYKDTWDKIDEMLDKVTSKKFRNKILDSFGNGWIYNWFCIDHVGFNGENPRRRDMGHHNIFDHYKSYNKLNSNTKDLIQWHFHPLPFIKDAHRCATSFIREPIIFEILARKIIDRKWFPTAYRAGFHTERPDSNWFLEQWIPFDFSNQAIKGKSTDQPDLAKGRFGDWRHAPAEWKVYHPSHEDYQQEGTCNRWIARCLNMEARLRELNIEDIRDGFKRAKSGKPTLISYTNHDFRDMVPEINKVRDMIEKVAKEYPDVKFKFCNAIEAMRRVLGIEELIEPHFNIKLNKDKKSSVIKIKSKNNIFGPQPFFAIKTKNGKYYWDNLDFQGKNKWSYTFDFNTLDISSIEKIGVAANTSEGLTEIVVMDPNTGKTEKEVLNT